MSSYIPWKHPWGLDRYKYAVLPVLRITIIEMRQSYDRLIFMMENTIPGKTVFTLRRAQVFSIHGNNIKSDAPTDAIFI